MLDPLYITNSEYAYTKFNDKQEIPYEWDNNNNFELLLYNFIMTGADALRSTILVSIRRKKTIKFKNV